MTRHEVVLWAEAEVGTWRAAEARARTSAESWAASGHEGSERACREIEADASSQAERFAFVVRALRDPEPDAAANSSPGAGLEEIDRLLSARPLVCFPTRLEKLRHAVACVYSLASRADADGAGR